MALNTDKRVAPAQMSLHCLIKLLYFLEIKSAKFSKDVLINSHIHTKKIAIVTNSQSVDEIDRLNPIKITSIVMLKCIFRFRSELIAVLIPFSANLKLSKILAVV